MASHVLQPLHHSGSDVRSFWHWNHDRLWIESFAAGRAVAGSYYRLTVPRALAEYMLDSSVN